LLERDLDRTADGRQVWVGNVGRDGMTTRDNVLHLKYLLRQYPRIDVIVSLVGVNDLVSALQQGWHYRAPTPVTEPDGERDEMPRAFAVVPGRLQDAPMPGPGPVPWYKATALWQLGRRAKVALRTHRTIRLGSTRDPLEVARLARASAPKIDSVPPLAAPLVEYRRNLNAMADLALAAGVRLVFVTQPAAWRDGPSSGGERQLWMGAIVAQGGSRAYLSTSALARVMARYNEAVLDVCRQRALACVDAAHVVPHDTTAMYDDVHFNEQGARLLARELAAHFRQHAPFLRRS
jgi:lysophospholipase L1-like esterase